VSAPVLRFSSHPIRILALPFPRPVRPKNPSGFSDPCLELAGRPLLAEGAAHAGGEEGPLRDEARRPQQQARMVRLISLSRLLFLKKFHSV
jgi:hypothetical protein